MVNPCPRVITKTTAIVDQWFASATPLLLVAFGPLALLLSPFFRDASLLLFSVQCTARALPSPPVHTPSRRSLLAVPSRCTFTLRNIVLDEPEEEELLSSLSLLPTNRHLPKRRIETVSTFGIGIGATFVATPVQSLCFEFVFVPAEDDDDDDDHSTSYT